jgi:hypothetical protein
MQAASAARRAVVSQDPCLSAAEGRWITQGSTSVGSPLPQVLSRETGPSVSASRDVLPGDASVYLNYLGIVPDVAPIRYATARVTASEISRKTGPSSPPSVLCFSLAGRGRTAGLITRAENMPDQTFDIGPFCITISLRKPIPQTCGLLLWRLRKPSAFAYKN